MKTQFLNFFKQPKLAVALTTALFCLGSVHSAMAITLAQSPLFLAKPVIPIVMLNMSNDHQLFFKVYDDYSDLDGINGIDTTYNNDIDYYGYFDEDKCYSYTSGLFSPVAFTTDHYCSNSNWSGNFMNWSAMTRIDVIRKILYGGKRSTDTAASTILERTHLPQDAHSYTKYYNGNDVAKLTPYPVTHSLSETAATGLTMCHTTNASGFSQSVTNAPKMYVVEGNYSLWASNERWQCRLGDNSQNSGNANDSSKSKIYAYPDSPTVTLGTFKIRVESCVTGLVNEVNNENCRSYATGLKPSGLLQAYGEDDQIHFGLLTGSYSKNKSGGVLRKNAGSMIDEVDADGVFVKPTDSIVKALDLLRVYGYNHNKSAGTRGTYNDGTSGDDCRWGRFSFSDGDCSNWGNPQSEIYLESLRYLAGESASSAFNTNDSGRFSGLTTATWVDPVTDANYCAPLNVIQFNASTSSYDKDQLSGSSDIGLTEAQLNTATNNIGQVEGINGESYFIGRVGNAGDQLCTAKTITGLSQANGTCPNAPRLEGSYQIAGLAHHARINSMGTVANGQARDTVTTYGVALAPAVPKAIVPSPSGGRSVTILPACRNLDGAGPGNCAIVDFKVVDDGDADDNTGTLYVNWEDSEQGGDFDQDMWGVISYVISDEKIEITTGVVAESTGFPMGFGYVLAGTGDDGFHVHSGIENFTLDECENCNRWDAPTTREYTLGGGSAKLLAQPLYYAAKWGGFDTSDGAVEPTAGVADTYYLATDPRTLQQNLRDAFDDAAQGAGSAASVATNSTRLGTDTFIYQALFNTKGWSGDLKAIKLSAAGGIAATATWNASEQLASAGSRNIITSDGTTATEFTWANLTADQQAALNASDNLGERRVAWIRGDDVGGMRERDTDKRIGDIVNSDPVFGGDKDFGFAKLEDHGSSSYKAFADAKTASDNVVYVNANDGMLHAFDAASGAELFAYIPSSVYGTAADSRLKNTTDSTYGTNNNPHKYLVDGQIFVGDIYTGGSWKTWLIGALGAGGKGFFVLDVTDPTGFGPNDVLYETNATDHPELGYIMEKPTIAPLPDGSWAIVMGNGYGSTSGEASLLLIKPAGTGLADLSITSIDTEVGGDNGLGEASMTIFSQGTVRSAYAGDLKGNMWKFDLDGEKVAFKQGSTPKPLFVAEDSNGNAQPITAAPVLGINQERKDSGDSAAIMVYFGTGKYLEKTDLLDISLQSYYGIADIGERVDRSDLFDKAMTQTGNTRTIIEGEDPNVTPLLNWEDKAGWLLDFDTEAGERVVSKALFVFDRVIFPTVIPADNACEYGGSSWVMELIGVGDLYRNHSVLEHKGLENDTLVSLSDLILGEDANSPGVIIQQNSDGTLTPNTATPPPSAFGRQSWRQLR